jgi:hypothetical protein
MCDQMRVKRGDFRGRDGGRDSGVLPRNGKSERRYLRCYALGSAGCSCIRRTRITRPPTFVTIVRACFKNGRGPAARDFGRGQGGETGASPLRAVTVEPTRDPGKRTAARRVFPKKVLWLRCSSVTERRLCSLVAPRQITFFGKTGPLRFLKQALTKVGTRFFTRIQSPPSSCVLKSAGGHSSAHP